MKTYLRSVILALIAVLSCSVAAGAQDPAPARTLQVEVTISRNAGTKVLSSTPYTMLVVAGERVSTRTQIRFPTQSTTTTAADDGKPASTVQSWSYQDLGTSIDCVSRVEPGGNYRIILIVADTSIYPAGDLASTQKAAAAPANTPSVRSFSSSNSAVLKDGQSSEFVVATDRLTGEVVKVGVKLTVVK